MLLSEIYQSVWESCLAKTGWVPAGNVLLLLDQVLLFILPRIISKLRKVPTKYRDLLTYQV